MLVVPALDAGDHRALLLLCRRRLAGRATIAQFARSTRAVGDLFFRRVTCGSDPLSTWLNLASALSRTFALAAAAVTIEQGNPAFDERCQRL